MEDESRDPTLTDSPMSSSSSITSNASSAGRTGAKSKRLQSVYHDEETGVSKCRNCGWAYPNPRPDSRQRREHKKGCEGIVKKAESGHHAGAGADRDRGSPDHLLRIEERDDVTGSGVQDKSDGSPGPHKLLGNSEMTALESEPFKIGSTSTQDRDFLTDDGECDSVDARSQLGWDDDRIGEDHGREEGHEEEDRLVNFDNGQHHDEENSPWDDDLQPDLHDPGRLQNHGIEEGHEEEDRHANFDIVQHHDHDLDECRPEDSQSDLHGYGRLEDRGEKEETQEEKHPHMDFVQHHDHDYCPPDDNRSQELNREDKSASFRSSREDACERGEAADNGRLSSISLADVVKIGVIGILCFFAERFLLNR